MNGSALDAGVYSSLVHQGRTDEHVAFEFDVTIPASKALSLSSHREGEPIVDAPFVRQLSRTQYWDEPDYWSYYSSVAGATTKVRRTRLKVSFHPVEPFGPTLSRVDFWTDSSIERDGDPISFVRTIGDQRESHWRTYVHKNLPSKSVDLMFRFRGFFPAVNARHMEYKGATRYEKQKINEFLKLFRATTASVENFITNQVHIGPFRTTPQRRYAFSGFGNLDVGPAGERAVDLLVMEQLLSPGKDGLRRATSGWLRHLGLADEIKLSAVAKDANLFSISLDNAGCRGEANIVDVGFGVSQILPVIVQGLLLSPGATFVVQQPEIHLHPDAQAGLADFLLYLASQGVNVLVETHSEYLLLRLRRRLAEGEARSPAPRGGAKDATFEVSTDMVSVVYTSEAPHEYRNLNIGPGFQFSNLPAGFMTEAVEDRMAILTAVSRSAQREETRARG
jgi:hypothetical protein